MKTYQILIEYVGSRFVGWQIQKNGLSVQETIQKNLQKVVKKKNYYLWLWKNGCRCTCKRTISTF